MSEFRFNLNYMQTLKSRLHGNLCHIRFGDLWSHLKQRSLALVVCKPIKTENISKCRFFSVAPVEFVALSNLTKYHSLRRKMLRNESDDTEMKVIYTATSSGF